jgi:hypothetical protein
MHLIVSLLSLFLFGAEPWGHWEGTISAQFGTVRIELDLTKSADGTPTATFSVPERKLSALPMASLTVDGQTVSFEPAGIGARFKGDISADGSELSGLFEATAGAVPVTLTRKGDARITPAPKSAAIAPELEGTWTGTLDVDGGKRLVLKMVNQPDETSSGTMVSVDEAGLELPVAIVQKSATLRVDVPGVASTYAGTLSTDGRELVGIYTTSQGLELPLTLRRK